MSRTIDHMDHRRDVPAEYWFYFVPILLIAMPTALVQWLLAFARTGAQRHNPSPLRRSMSAAHGITPQIFSA